MSITMMDDLIDLLAETRVALSEMLCNAEVPIGYSPHLAAAKHRVVKASAEIERLRALVRSMGGDPR